MTELELLKAQLVEHAAVIDKLLEALAYIAIDDCEAKARGGLTCFESLESTKNLPPDDIDAGFSEYDFCNPCYALKTLQ